MRVIKTSFSGNKSNRVKEIAELTKNGEYTRIVEIFGGSCVISNNLLKEKIVEEAIANDYSILHRIRQIFLLFLYIPRF